ncbi:MAG TPA: hypothetical protein VNV88_12025 [Candidatus Solibacter sp.]|jgi:hypothetical protein|nr:hypothetical protein [Candidatus Solibacter sp.]
MNRSFRLFLIFCVMLAIMPFTAVAQTQTAPAQKTEAAPQAKENDVDSIEHIIAALYDVISGPAGPRDWDRMHSLFYAGARLIPSRRDKSGKVTAFNLSVDDYIARSRPFFDKEGFVEAPVANRIESWDHIAHVWSTYESRHAKGEKPFARGINSIQLLHDGNRWWILTVYWESEEEGHPLPEKYLSK